MALQHSVLAVQVACIAPQQVLPAPPHASEAAHAGLAGLHVLPRAIRQAAHAVSIGEVPAPFAIIVAKGWGVSPASALYAAAAVRLAAATTSAVVEHSARISSAVPITAALAETVCPVARAMACPARAASAATLRPDPRALLPPIAASDLSAKMENACYRTGAFARSS